MCSFLSQKTNSNTSTTIQIKRSLHERLHYIFWPVLVLQTQELFQWSKFRQFPHCGKPDLLSSIGEENKCRNNLHGCPIAHPKLTKRPSAKRIMFFPLFNVKRSTWGLMLVFWAQFSSNHLTSISQSKCPILQTMASFFILSKSLPVMISLQPVVVTKMEQRSTQSSRVVT